MSSAWPSATVARIAPVAGFGVSNVLPERADRHSLSMNSLPSVARKSLIRLSVLMSVTGPPGPRASAGETRPRTHQTFLCMHTECQVRPPPDPAVPTPGFLYVDIHDEAPWRGPHRSCGAGGAPPPAGSASGQAELLDGLLDGGHAQVQLLGQRHGA